MRAGQGQGQRQPGGLAWSARGGQEPNDAASEPLLLRGKDSTQFHPQIQNIQILLRQCRIILVQRVDNLELSLLADAVCRVHLG